MQSNNNEWTLFAMNVFLACFLRAAKKRKSNFGHKCLIIDGEDAIKVTVSREDCNPLRFVLVLTLMVTSDSK